MATKYGQNAQAIINKNKVAPGMVNGKVQTVYDKFVFDADVNAIGQKIELGALVPKGAKVLSSVVKSASLGTTGIFKLGYKATDADSSDRSADLGSGFDAGGQAVLEEKLLLNEALTEDKQMVLEATEATDSAEGEAVEVLVKYVVD